MKIIEKKTNSIQCVVEIQTDFMRVDKLFIQYPFLKFLFYILINLILIVKKKIFPIKDRQKNYFLNLEDSFNDNASMKNHKICSTFILKLRQSV